jgi:folate-binding protein YgfZ
LKKNCQFIDPRLDNFGYRFYQNITQNHDNKIDNVVNYHLHRIINKIPEAGYDLIYDKSFIAEYDFDNLNAVSYNKGCYVGQEATARNHFRGVVRKKIFYFEIKNCSPQLIDFLDSYDNLNSLQIDYENLKLRSFFDNPMIEDENHKEIGMVLSNIYFKSTNEIKGLTLLKIDENHQIISSNLNFLNNQILIKN